MVSATKLLDCERGRKVRIFGENNLDAWPRSDGRGKSSPSHGDDCGLSSRECEITNNCIDDRH